MDRADPSPSSSFPEVFAALERDELTPERVQRAFAAILQGEWTPVQIAAFAAALRIRGETAAQVTAAAAALRAVMREVPHTLPEVIDTCGTGGDGANTINVSTAAAIVVAAAGARVAKHGNRSVSSRSGSADVVAALGVPLELTPARHAALLHEVGITFLMAPHHHPALAHAASARRELGVRTIFNALGPLVNPARVTHQLVGVYDDGLRPIVAAALGRLGVRRAWVVRSADGLDELSPAAPTRVSVLSDGAVTERVVSPNDFGIATGNLEALRGGDAAANADAILRILDGELHPATDAVVLNAAAALAVLRPDVPLLEHAAKAREVLEQGAARTTLDAWRAAAQRASIDPDRGAT